MGHPAKKLELWNGVDPVCGMDVSPEAFGKLEPFIGNIVQMVQLSIGRNSYASRQSTCRTDV